MVDESAVTLKGRLRYWARQSPGKTAVVDLASGMRLSYQEFMHGADGIAQHLAHLGVSAGTRVAYAINGPGPATLMLCIAINTLSATWVPLYPRSTARERDALLRHGHIEWLIVDDTVNVPDPLSTTKVLTLASLSDAPACLRPLPENSEADNIAGMLYTSGTTGAPKAALHTERSLLGWIDAFVTSHHWTRDDRILNPYPLYHMGGVGFSFSALSLGATLVLLGSFEPRRVIDALASERISTLIAVPTMWMRLLQALPADFDPARHSPMLEKISATSAPLWHDTEVALRKTWPQADLYVLYSATEAVFTMRGPKDAPHRPGSVGKPVYGTDVSIRDANGQRVAPRTPGLIYVRGLSVFFGYSPESVVPAGTFLPGGWVTCHDVGYQDADGFFYVIDRSRDLIKTGGETVSSVEVEDVLTRHPRVREAAVVGRLDADWGERVHAVVSPYATDPAPDDALSREVLHWCRQFLSPYKVPKTIEWIPDLPKSPVGKILKRALADHSSVAP